MIEKLVPCISPLPSHENSSHWQRRAGRLGTAAQSGTAGEVVALDSDSVRLCGNFADLEGNSATARQFVPDVIVNAAAHTAVDKAETEPELARTLNALAPGVSAAEAQELGPGWCITPPTMCLTLVAIHVGETDKPSPLSVYGRTKLEVGIAVDKCEKHLIFRMSCVYAARGANFAETILRPRGSGTGSP